ncbi:MAG: PfkB family carbohydrate kinase [Spirochaetales bacterium]|nr:PfkB family carbohydrate kinase [Spirochaetales bacterium]
MKIYEDENSFLAVGLSPAIQKTLFFDKFTVGNVNRTTSYRTDASGKCINVARVLAQAGANSDCITIAGEENYNEFKKLCDRDSLNLKLVKTAGRVRTCTTLLDKSIDQYTEIVAGEPEIITRSEEAFFKEEYLSMLENGYKAVILSGSRIKGFSDDIVPFILKEAKLKGALFVADYRGKDLLNSFISEDIHPDLVKINEEELYQTFGEAESLEHCISEVSVKYKTSFVLSRGAESTIAANDGQVFVVKNNTVPVVNPIGCGDSMTAGIAQGLADGLSLKEAVERGRDYAALNLQNIKPGWILSE